MNSMIRTARLLVALAAAIVPAMAAEAAAEAGDEHRTLLIISKTDHVLELRDPETFEIRARVPVGPDPHEIVVSPDGSKAYVSNPGYGSLHEIDVIDLVGGKALPSIDTMPLMGPHGLVLLTDRLWFTAQASKSIGRIDLKTRAVDWAMGTGQNTTHMLHVSPSGKRVFTTNVESGTVSIFEQVLVQPTTPPTGVLPDGAKPRLDWMQTVVPVGSGAEGFGVSPDEGELWTVTPDGTISIIDTSEKHVTASIDSGLVGAHRLAFTPDGSRVIIVSVKTGDFAVYDAGSRREIRRLRIGRGAGIYIDAEKQRAFVSCTPDGFVSVIDLKTLTEIRRIDVARPDGVTIATGRGDRRGDGRG